MRRSPVVIIVLLVVLAAGCGGSDTPENTASVNQIQTFADQQLALRLDANQSADPFTCEQDGDRSTGTAPPRFGPITPTTRTRTKKSFRSR